MVSLRNLLVAGVTLAAAAVLPAAANAANGYVTASVNMRSGPSTAYPPVTVIPDGASVDIIGCLTGFSWCDVAWRGYRGWVSSNYLDYFAERRRYRLPEYGPRYGVPIITFNFGYWDRYYRDRPFYRERHRFFHDGPHHRPPRFDNPRPRPPVIRDRPPARPPIIRDRPSAHPPVVRDGPRRSEVHEGKPPRRERERDRRRHRDDDDFNQTDHGPRSPRVH